MNIKKIISFLFFLSFGFFLMTNAEEYSIKKLLKEKKDSPERVSLNKAELRKLLADLDRILFPPAEKREVLGRNPFLPEINLKKEKKIDEKAKKEQKPLELKGIVIQKDQRYIIVGDEIFRIGDMVFGKKIIKIDMGKVCFLSDGKIETIFLE